MPEIFWLKVSLKLQKIILGQWINGLYISLQIMAERAEMNKPCSSGVNFKDLLTYERGFRATKKYMGVKIPSL